MIDSLFGAETPLLVKLIVAFAVVLALIAASTWALRRVGGTRLGVTTPRGRQPRLAVIDAAAVDTRRRLVLIRRDNVEHLIMIGGPSDVVIEPNIVRAVPVAATRELAPARGAGSEPSVEPPAPAPMGRPPEMVRDLPRASNVQGFPPPRAPAPPEPQRAPLSPEALFGGAPDLGRPARPEAAPSRRGPGGEPPRPPRQRPAAPRAENEAPIEVHQAPPTADTNLADMAMRLEEALKRPGGGRKDAETRTQPARRDSEGGRQTPAAPATSLAPARAESTPARQAAAAAAAPAAAALEAPSAPAADAATATQEADASKSVFDSLEEEMASLLNRPPGKE